MTNLRHYCNITFLTIIDITNRTSLKTKQTGNIEEPSRSLRLSKLQLGGANQNSFLTFSSPSPIGVTVIDAARGGGRGKAAEK